MSKTKKTKQFEMPPLFRIEHLKQYVIYSDTKIYKQNKKMVTF